MPDSKHLAYEDRMGPCDMSVTDSAKDGRLCIGKARHGQ